ncbi:MAG: DUF808 domain-containing protein [Proteobacteria bacterium]|nr:DUF808 domain-containing protein [Pseudomonadota bacterium]
MAGISLLTLIDDIATTLDDVAAMTKVAAKKTAGVLGDDLALNAKQASGVSADRELPVVWAVAKGSVINKIILVPLALFFSQISPILVKILLLIGGLFLCFEGFEKVFEKIVAPKKQGHHPKEKAYEDLSSYEKDKIKGAVRTDFILSAEIVVITLGAVAGKKLLTQFLVLSSVSSAMTIGVYGLVALIVKVDDLGLILLKKAKLLSIMGRALLVFSPALMKLLGVLGTIAMFLVGGGILTHSVPAFIHFQEKLAWPILSVGFDFLFGFFAGGIVAGILHLLPQKRLHSS